MVARGLAAVGIKVCDAAESGCASIGLPAVVAYNFNSEKTCFGLHMEMEALAGLMYVVIEIGWCPLCISFDIEIFSWDAIKLPTVTTCTT